MNYCQLALSECDSSLGRVVCSPGLVNNPYSGSDHCVSEPVTYSVGSSKGDAGTWDTEACWYGASLDGSLCNTSKMYIQQVQLTSHKSENAQKAQTT